MNKFFNRALAIVGGLLVITYDLDNWTLDAWWWAAISILAGLVWMKWFWDAAESYNREPKYRAMLLIAHYQFNYYAEQHRLKDTPDSARKAVVNQAMADQILETLDA